MRKRLPSSGQLLYGRRLISFTDRSYSFDDLYQSANLKKKIPSLPAIYISSLIIDDLSPKPALDCLMHHPRDRSLINLTLYPRPGEKMVSLEYNQLSSQLLTSLSALLAADTVTAEVVFPPKTFDLDKLPRGRWRISSANLTSSASDEEHLSDIIESSSLIFDQQISFNYYRSSSHLINSSGGRSALRSLNQASYLNVRLPLKEITKED